MTSSKISKDSIPESIRDIYSCDNLPGGFFVYRESDGTILSVNNQMLALFGCSTKEEFFWLTSGKYEMLICDEDRPVQKRNLIEQKENEDFSSHSSFRIRTAGGNLRYVEEYRHRINTREEGYVYFVFLSDLASGSVVRDTDHITGLMGVRHFLTLADKYNQNGRTDSGTAMLFINLLNFRYVSINLGMEAGDHFLLSVAQKLKEIFPDSPVSRCDVDHFVILAEHETPDSLKEKLQALHLGILDVLSKVRMDCKIGVCFWENRNEDAERIFTCAKLACESIRHTTGQYSAFFTDATTRRLECREYVAAHLDQAICENWIIPYFQPIIRTLSGRLCGLEALARWEDPKRGTLSPDEFIAPLESNHEIYKMDLHIIEQVCRILQTKLRHNQDIVPVSVNLSRLDFLCCDIFKQTENIIRKYDIPRDMIHIEITESAFVQNDIHFQRGIQNFRRAGYEIWMDDFGSGYSTLGMLKDFTFDVLKMDMTFLRSRSERTKTIINSIIEMDKNLNNRTLAEGVETQEQYHFLKNAGCDKVQGYYFGKPMPYEECMQNCANRHIPVEQRCWRNYFDALGEVKFNTDLSLAITEYDGHELHYLFANDKFIEALKSGGTESLSACENETKTSKTPFGRAFHLVADYAATTSKEQTFDYPSQDQFMRMKTRKLAECGGRTLFAASLDNITSTRNLSQTSILLENLYYIYDDVMLIDIKGNQIRHVVLDTGQEHSTFDLRLKFFRYAKERIYPRDYERFTAFSDPETLSKRISESERSMLRAFFRTREDTGNYVWKEYAFMRIPKMKADVALMTVRTIDTKDVDIVLRSENEKTGLQYQSSYSDEAADDITKEKALLWDNIVQHSTLNFFWKDIHRRFLGASQSFLDYYGLDSVSDIIGKTDEDMVWHVDEDTYKNEEYDVLRSGKTSKYYPGKCISRGINRNIMATKHPLYKGGEIIGLAGFFIDADELNQANGKADLIPVIDPVTGLNNTRGIMEALTWYSENYRMRGKDFAVIAVDIPEIPRLLQAYGDDFNKKILRALANAVLDVMKNRGTVGHISAGQFILLLQYSNKRAVFHLANAVRDKLQGIRGIDGLNCTLFPQFKIGYASESTSMEKLMFDSLVHAEAPEAGRPEIDTNAGNSDILSDQNFHYIIDHLPVGAYIVRPDRTIIYWNHAAEEITGYHKEEMIDKTCPETGLSHMDKNGMPLCELLCPLLRSIETGETDKRKMWALHKDNYRILLDTMLVPIRGKDGRIVAAAELFERVTPEHYSEDMVKSLYDAATHDPVSGLHGRRYMESFLKYKLSEFRNFHTPFAVLFIDLDEFHAFNNTYGHDAGDRVLKSFGDAVSGTLRKSDIFGRWGGDEFLAVAKIQHPEDMLAIAERISHISELLSTTSRAGDTLNVTLSLGITAVRDGDDMDTLVDRADRYMYKAKSQDSCIYYTDFDAERDSGV